jgi:pimeloyl-ACP methyl ester carboxylesterase/TM2 domain-containing membrane protein YozV
MDTNQPKNTSTIKKRRPVLAAFLSLISLGLGQVYNGEIGKGITLNLIFWGVFLWTGWYTASAYFGQSYDLIFFLITLGGFLILKIYSIGQAFIGSRKKGTSYRLKPVNRWFVYLLFVLILLVPPFMLNNAIRNQSQRDTSPPHPFRSEKAQAAFLDLYDKRASHWPVIFETRMVHTAFGNTYVRISGPEEGRPLVLLHGGPSNSLQWMPNIKALSKEYRTYAIDIIIGTGRSIMTRRMEKPSELTKWLDETLTGLGLQKKICLIGLSYGGWIASQYALSYSNRLHKLVLIAPAATVSPLSMQWITHAVLSMIPHRHFIRNFLYWNLPDFVNKDHNELDRIVEEAFLAMRCFKPTALMNPTVLNADDWKRIRIPLLFLIGENERIYAESAEQIVHKLQNCAPRIITKIIPYAGHDLTFVQADRVNRAILEFLQEQQG